LIETIRCGPEACASAGADSAKSAKCDKSADSAKSDKHAATSAARAPLPLCLPTDNADLAMIDAAGTRLRTPGSDAPSPLDIRSCGSRKHPAPGADFDGRRI
ncbi:MAG: hypothetical protein KDJ30_14000, partial [Rhodoblastus sp.]|nr:hypothetical protein [Rhodoblastus sp.]